jgi:hypothetical protein
MEDPALLAYSDARSEYTRQLCQFLVPATFSFFMKLLEKARQEVGRDVHKTLFQYQVYLQEIPDWNMEKVSNEIRQLEMAIGCEYLEDLLTAVFIAHTKILTAIRVSSKKSTNVQINVPKVERFLFKVICEMSKLYWKNTFLFRDDVKNLDKQQNYRQAEGMIVEGISMAIRALVPVKNILRECVVMDDKNQVEADTDSDDDTAAAAAATAAADADAAADATADAVVGVAAVAAAAAAVADVSAESASAAAAVADVVAEHPVVKALLQPVESSAATASADVDVDVSGSDESPVLNIDEQVSFAEYDTVFDGDNSNLIFDPKTAEQQSPTGLLEISDEPPMDLDIDDIAADDAPASALSADDFEELS